MKLIDSKIGESISIRAADKIIRVIPQQKSGSRIRFAIDADKDVIIGDSIPLLEDGITI